MTFNIQRGVNGVEAEYLDATGAEMLDFTKGNVKAADADGRAVRARRPGARAS